MFISYRDTEFGRHFKNPKSNWRICLRRGFGRRGGGIGSAVAEVLRTRAVRVPSTFVRRTLRVVIPPLR